VSESWRLKGTYSWIHLDITTGREVPEDFAPQNMFSVNSYKNFSEEFELNSTVFFQDSLREGSSDSISSWVRFDSGLVWHVNEDMDFGLWGQNLLDSRHQEFLSRGFINRGGSEVPRSVFLEMTYRF
jgi:outer membrane receptor protein involved in Fe transport